MKKNIELEPLLKAEWTSAMSALGIDPKSTMEVFGEIIAAYSSPDRIYHNIKHLSEMSSFLKDYSHLLDRPAETILSLFFHDVVYDSKAKDNEKMSADLARSRLESLGLNKDAISLVENFVLSTINHSPVMEGADNALFLDADLSILGSVPEKYFAYARAIRQEYSWVPEQDYNHNRKAVLENFLNRSEIFFTEQVKQSLEKQARINIKGEIQILTM